MAWQFHPALWRESGGGQRLGGCWEDAHWGFPAPSKHSLTPQPASCPPGPESNTRPPPQAKHLPLSPTGGSGLTPDCQEATTSPSPGDSLPRDGVPWGGGEKRKGLGFSPPPPPRLFPSRTDSKRNVLIGITSSLNVETHTQVHPHKCRKFTRTHTWISTHTHRRTHTLKYTRALLNTCTCVHNHT